MRNQSHKTTAEPHFSKIRWVAHGRLAAATVWPMPSTSGPLEHAALVAAIHARINMLPVRYGTVLPDEEAVRHFLGNRRENLLDDLDRLHGTAEIGLRIELPDSPLPTGPLAASGSYHADISPVQYLAARRVRYQWHDQLETNAQLAVATCVRALSGLYRNWQRLSPEPLGIVRLAFLVERKLSDAFAERVEMFTTMKIGRRCTLVGPWPPYSFV
ncbi:MAG: GvpL/GvpF family gas vesicle protein [Thermoguttaceae bacterium]